MFGVWKQIHGHSFDQAERRCFDSLGGRPAQADRERKGIRL